MSPGNKPSQASHLRSPDPSQVKMPGLAMTSPQTARFSVRKKVGPPTSSKMFSKQMSTSGDINQDPESDEDEEPVEDKNPARSNDQRIVSS